MCGCNCNGLSSIQFKGDQGVSIISVSTESGEGNDTVVTFGLSDGSELGPIVIPGGTNGENGQNGENAEAYSYIYQSIIGNPVETISTGYTGYASTDLSLPAQTLGGNGATLEFWIDLSFPDNGTGATIYTANVHLNSSGTITFARSHTNSYIYGIITRVSNTEVYFEITHKTTPQYAVANNFISSGFKTVADLDSNPFDVQLYINNNSGDDVLLKRFLSRITQIV